MLRNIIALRLSRLVVRILRLAVRLLLPDTLLRELPSEVAELVEAESIECSDTSSRSDSADTWDPESSEVPLTEEETS